MLLGQEAPHIKGFCVFPGGEVKEIDTEMLLGEWTLLFCVPSEFGPICATEIMEFNKEIKSFQDLDCNIVGMTHGSVLANIAWTKAESGIGQLQFPLMGDIGSKNIKNFGWKYPSRGSAIISPDWKLMYISSYPYQVKRDVQEILRVLRSVSTEKSSV